MPKKLSETNMGDFPSHSEIALFSELIENESRKGLL